MKIVFEDNCKLDRRSWLRLMGVTDEHRRMAKAAETGSAGETAAKTKAAIDRLMQQMDEAETLLFDAAEPAFTYEVFGIGTLPVQGVSLAKHLEGCNRIAVMAVTLGSEVDHLISETQEHRIALGVVIDSGASIMAELATNMAEEQIRNEIAEKEPIFMTGRFSPGYGDSPLEMQAEVLDLLHADERLGITLSKGYMMNPSKSITAIMGLADHPVTGRLATCEECVLREKCQLRKEGMRCGAAK